MDPMTRQLNFQIGWLQSIIRRQARSLGLSENAIQEMLEEAERKAKEYR